MTTLTFEQYEALSFEEKLERLDKIYQSQINTIKEIKEFNEKIEYFNHNFENKIVEI